MVKEPLGLDVSPGVFWEWMHCFNPYFF
jgi:hypothetical protein